MSLVAMNSQTSAAFNEQAWIIELVSIFPETWPRL
jgi:hypothetical protein